MQLPIETPSALALILCDTIITDAATGKKTLVGIFNSIKVARFPHVIPQFFVFASLTNATGEVPVAIRLTAASGEEIFNLNGKLPFKTPLDAPEMVFHIQNLPIRAEGVYDLELIANSVSIASRTLTIKL